MNAASLHTAGPAVRTKIGQIGYFMSSCTPSSRTMYAAKFAWGPSLFASDQKLDNAWGNDVHVA
ncbi:hypothetical protein [Mesorhizobium sp. M0208]